MNVDILFNIDRQSILVFFARIFDAHFWSNTTMQVFSIFLWFATILISLSSVRISV